MSLKVFERFTFPVTIEGVEITKIYTNWYEDEHGYHVNVRWNGKDKWITKQGRQWYWGK